jgi:hypothetical protein
MRWVDAFKYLIRSSMYAIFGFSRVNVILKHGCYTITLCASTSFQIGLVGKDIIIGLSLSTMTREGPLKLYQVFKAR